MASFLFGKYLLQKGLVTQSQLDEGFAFLAEHNKSLGSLAVEKGILTPDQVEIINQGQAHADQFFGELAISNGYADEDVIRQLMIEQVTSKLSISEALLRLGFLKSNKVDDLLADYQYWQNRIQKKNQQVINQLQHAAYVKVFISELIKQFRRFCHIRYILDQILIGLAPNGQGNECLIYTISCEQPAGVSEFKVGLVVSPEDLRCFNNTCVLPESQEHKDRSEFFLSSALTNTCEYSCTEEGEYHLGGSDRVTDISHLNGADNGTSIQFMSEHSRLQAVFLQ